MFTIRQKGGAVQFGDIPPFEPRCGVLVEAIRIEGHFDYVRARSVPKQSNYLPLAEIAKLQTVFEFRDVAGTIVGLYTPTFLSGVHLPGLHLHFITADRTKGGHLLAASPNGRNCRNSMHPRSNWDCR